MSVACEREKMQAKLFLTLAKEVLRKAFWREKQPDVEKRLIGYAVWTSLLALQVYLYT